MISCYFTIANESQKTNSYLSSVQKSNASKSTKCALNNGNSSIPYFYLTPPFSMLSLITVPQPILVLYSVDEVMISDKTILGLIL